MAYMERSSKAYGYTKEKLCGVVKLPTAIHNIKSNKGNKTAGVDKAKMDKYLQMPKDKVVGIVQRNLRHYLPKPARRVYIDKGNGKMRPLGIPTILDRMCHNTFTSLIWH